MGDRKSMAGVNLPEQNCELLQEIGREEGIALFGIADLAEIRDHFHPSLGKFTHGMRYGISLGLRLSDAILDQLQGGPTLLYKHHYKAVNYLLDQVALRLVCEIQQMGYAALPIPASQVVDWDTQRGHLSHREVARGAGLGWIGRSGLLVHPQHGARIRLATVLTDMPLSPDSPLSQDCGPCRACIPRCPANAITEEGYQLDACVAKLREFSARRGIGVLICGVCVQACPITIQVKD